MKFESEVRRKGQGSHRTKNKFSLPSRTSKAWRNTEILVCFLLNKYHVLSNVFVWDITLYEEIQAENGSLRVAIKKD